MNSKLIFIFIALFAINNCWEVLPAEELNLKFLAAENEDKGRVYTKLNCEDSYPFLNSRAKVNPTTVVKGDKISLKIVGQSNKPLTIKNIHVVAKLNDIPSFDDTRQINKDIDAGSNFVYSYEVNVPTFIPEGKFDIQIFLQDASDTNIACFNAWFSY